MALRRLQSQRRQQERRPQPVPAWPEAFARPMMGTQASVLMAPVGRLGHAITIVHAFSPITMIATNSTTGPLWSEDHATQRRRRRPEQPHQRHEPQPGPPLPQQEHHQQPPEQPRPLERLLPYAQDANATEQKTVIRRATPSAADQDTVRYIQAETTRLQLKAN